MKESDTSERKAARAWKELHVPKKPTTRKKSVTIKEADIDAAFAKMATDLDYQRDAIALTREFETSDRDASLIVPVTFGSSPFGG